MSVVRTSFDPRIFIAQGFSGPSGPPGRVPKPESLAYDRELYHRALTGRGDPIRPEEIIQLLETLEDWMADAKENAEWLEETKNKLKEAESKLEEIESKLEEAESKLKEAESKLIRGDR